MPATQGNIFPKGTNRGNSVSSVSLGDSNSLGYAVLSNSVTLGHSSQAPVRSALGTLVYTILSR